MLAAVNRAKTVIISHPGYTKGNPNTIRGTITDPMYPKYSGYFLLKRRHMIKSKTILYDISIALVKDTTIRNTVIKNPS